MYLYTQKYTYTSIYAYINYFYILIKIMYDNIKLRSLYFACSYINIICMQVLYIIIYIFGR